MAPKRKSNRRSRPSGRGVSRGGRTSRRGAGRSLAGAGRPGRRSRRSRRAAAARHVEALLDSASGKSDESHDRRATGEAWRGVRTLDLTRNHDLFESLVTLDFDFLMSRNFAADLRTLADLLPQSVVGRAQNGHGWFSDEYGVGLRFPDATFERVLSVLERNDPNLRPQRVRRRRGERLERFGRWLVEHMNEPQLELVVDGAPLLGVDFLAQQRVDTEPFLRGLILAGFMDDWSHRRSSMFEYKRTFAGLPYQIGGGEILVVDREKFELVGLGDTGQSVFVEEQLRTLKDIGVLCRDPRGDYAFPEHDQAFFRRRLGDGVCDDMALIWIGAHYGLSGLFGAFVMDAIDTYDKYLLKMTWGGYDAWLAEQLQHIHQDRHGRPLVGDEEILALIHFAAKRNDPPVNLSSSHRRLIQVEKHSAVPTVLNHWRFLQGEPVYDTRLGYSRVPAREFYDVAWQRLSAIDHGLPRPEFCKEGDKR